MTHQEKYENLISDLRLIEKSHKVYLADECVDRENVLEDKQVIDGSDEFWFNMYYAACFAAGCRAEENGLDINDLLGRIIF